MNLTELSKKVHQGNVDKGFYEEHYSLLQKMNDLGWELEYVDSYTKAFIDQRLALVTTEISEAVESNRKNKYADIKEFYKDKQGTPFHFKSSFESHIKDTVEDELADSLIRILDLAGYMGIDLQMHVDTKLHYNSLREHKHGKAY